MTLAACRVVFGAFIEKAQKNTNDDKLLVVIDFNFRKKKPWQRKLGRTVRISGISAPVQSAFGHAVLTGSG